LGINVLVICLANLLELCTFFLVVKLMLPITQSDRKLRSKFQRFLFKGFADINELKAAILVNHIVMTEEQRARVDYDCALLASLTSSSSTQSILGGMVEVQDGNDNYMAKYEKADQQRFLAGLLNEPELETE
jgi:hypothetical protein